MDRQKIQQAIPILLQLEQADLNKEAKHLKQRINKDKKELETLRDDFKQTYKKTEAQKNEISQRLHKLKKEASRYIEAIKKNTKISTLKKKKLMEIAKDSNSQIMETLNFFNCSTVVSRSLVFLKNLSILYTKTTLNIPLLASSSSSSSCGLSAVVPDTPPSMYSLKTSYSLA